MLMTGIVELITPLDLVPTDSGAAFLFEVPGSHSPLVVQELKIGGTGVVNPPDDA